MKSCFHYAMHTIYLGIGRDIVSNILADMVDCGVLGPGSLDEQLRRLSLDMHKRFKQEGFPGHRILCFANSICFFSKTVSVVSGIWDGELMLVMISIYFWVYCVPIE